MELFVKKNMKRKNEAEDGEEEDSDAEMEGSAKKKKRLSLEAPEVVRDSPPPPSACSVQHPARATSAAGAY